MQPSTRRRNALVMKMPIRVTAAAYFVTQNLPTSTKKTSTNPEVRGGLDFSEWREFSSCRPEDKASHVLRTFRDSNRTRRRRSWFHRKTS